MRCVTGRFLLISIKHYNSSSVIIKGQSIEFRSIMSNIIHIHAAAELEGGKRSISAKLMHHRRRALDRGALHMQAQSAQAAEFFAAARAARSTMDTLRHHNRVAGRVLARRCISDKDTAIPTG
jgi:hypothetical protein